MRHVPSVFSDDLLIGSESGGGGDDDLGSGWGAAGVGAGADLGAGSRGVSAEVGVLPSRSSANWRIMAFCLLVRDLYQERRSS